MNQARKKKIQQIIDDLGEIIEEEQTAHDNLPESIQESEKGDHMQTMIDGMQEAQDTLLTLIE